uniref:Uncharacterized protein n=1 Tax=Nelumbo nucifera TaxID=4432 RepID=A0A822YKX2_NELNU|nr:TPA_asm: hypothetical protein HUJ06_010476 [Nelumbo nucifera]
MEYLHCCQSSAVRTQNALSVLELQDSLCGISLLIH